MKSITNLLVKVFRLLINLIAKEYPKEGEAVTQFWYVLFSSLAIIASFVTLIYI